MDEFYNTLTRPGVLILALCVFILTFFIRRLVEIMFPRLKKRTEADKAPYVTAAAMWWNEVILFLIPVVLGAGIAVLCRKISYVMPVEPITVGGSILWGIVIGWFSGFFYKVCRNLLKAKTGVDLDLEQVGKDASGS